jgi:hypothetical protein
VVSGCFLLVTRELWNAVGGFDESFFMYGEDFDLCLRARRLGARPLFTPDATIIHLGGQSDRVVAEQTIRQYRARVQYFRKHWSPLAAWTGVRLLDLWALNKLVRAHLLQAVRRPGKDSLETWRGIWKRRSEWSRLDKSEPTGALGVS